MDATLYLFKTLWDRDLYQYPIILIVYIASYLLVKKVGKRTLFVWFASMPLTIFMYLAWARTWPSHPSFVVTLIFDVLLAQAGWLGGILSLISFLGGSENLKNAGFAISVASVFVHVIFVLLLASSTNSSF